MYIHSASDIDNLAAEKIEEFTKLDELLKWLFID